MSMRVYFKRAGRYIGVDPSFPSVVYADRDSGGAWEECELVAHDAGQFTAVFVETNMQLSIQPDGSLQTRSNANPPGSYELPYCTSQPDGSNFAYRIDNGVVIEPILQIEAKQ